MIGVFAATPPFFVALEIIPFLALNRIPSESIIFISISFNLVPEKSELSLFHTVPFLSN